MDEKKVIDKLLNSLKDDTCDLFEVLTSSFEEIKNLEYSNYLEKNEKSLNEIREQINEFSKEGYIAHLLTLIAKRDMFLDKLGLWYEFKEELRKETMNNPMEETFKYLMLNQFIEEEYDKKNKDVKK